MSEGQEGKPKQSTVDTEKIRERELNDFSWGEGYMTMENYSGSWDCPNDGYDFATPSNLRETIVGVNKVSVQKEGKNYGAVCECPKCFERFWFHIMDEYAEIIKWQYENDDLKVKPKK